MSTFIVCLITLDRLLVLHSPLTRAHQWKHGSHTKVCAVAWTLGIMLATTPLLPVAPHWNLYSQTSICAPFAVFRTDSSSNGMLETAFLSVLCSVSILTVAGTLVLSLHMFSSHTALRDVGVRVTETNITRRLLNIVLTNAFCWLVVGLLHVLDSEGVHMSSSLKASVAFVVMPISSAVNPCLYNINVLLEKRRIKREERIKRQLFRSVEVQLKTTDRAGATVCTTDEALASFDQWLKAGVLTVSSVAHLYEQSPSREFHPVSPLRQDRHGAQTP